MPARPENLGTRRKFAVILALASLANYGKSVDHSLPAPTEATNHNWDLGRSIGLSRIALAGYDESAITLADVPNNQISIGKISQSFESSSNQATVPISNSTSTNTSDWRCIKNAESGDYNGNYIQTSGAFGFLTSSWVWTLQTTGIASPQRYPVPGDAPPPIQNEAALFLYGYNHHHFHGAWNDYCTYNGIVN